MIISNKCMYGLKAMLELAIRHGQGPVTIGQIAQIQSIPVRFLEAILRQLKQAGLTESVRGKEGGYSLARDPKAISVGEIIRLIEGPLISVNPGATADTSLSSLPVPDVFADLWTSAQSALDQVFFGTTLADLVDQNQHRSQAQAMNYSI